MDPMNSTKVSYTPTTTPVNQGGQTGDVGKTTANGMTGMTFSPEMLRDLFTATDNNGSGVTNRSGGQTIPSNMTAEGLVNKLKEFISGASDRTALFSALIELMNSQRQNAVEQRANARETAKTQMLEGANMSREAADKQKEAAISSLVGGIISGAMQILGGAISLGAQVKFSNTTHLTEAATNKASSIHTAQQQYISAFTGAAGSITSGSGQQAGAMQQSEASNLQADSQEMQATSQDSQTQQDIEKKFTEDLTQAIQSIIQFIKEVRSSEIERMSSITRG